MNQAKVFIIPLRNLVEILQGRSRVLNLPSDAEIVAAVPARDGIGIRVHSHTYPTAEYGEPLPLVTATLERGRR